MKKILAFMLACIFVCLTIPTVFAASSTTTLTIESKTVLTTDEQVVLKFSLSNASAIQMLGILNITFDNEVFSLASGTWTLPGTPAQKSDYIQVGGNYIANAFYNSETDCNGDVFVLTLNILDGVAPSEYEVNCMFSAQTSAGAIKTEVVKGVISVEAPAASVDAVTLNKDKLSLKSGEEERLIATVLPDNATNKAVIWKSSDNTVVTVSDTGKVTAIKEGMAIITVTTQDGSYSASCTVSVACSHSFDLIDGFAATCDEDGNNAFYICDYCNKAFKTDGITETTVEAERIPALGHDMVAATCTKAAACKREGCGHIQGEALGHNYNAQWGQGESGHWHICNVCNEPGEVASHVPGAEATENSNQVCTVCGYVITPALGHTHTTARVEGFAATCTEAGQKIYYTCDCGKWFENVSATAEIADHASVKVAALGHDLSPATCTQPATCKREGCDYTQGETLEHIWLDATCQTPATCQSCGLTQGEVRPHKESDWQFDIRVHWKLCHDCGKELPDTRQAHTDGNVDEKCDVCGGAIPTADLTNPSTGDKEAVWIFMCFMSVVALLLVTVLENRKRIGG